MELPGYAELWNHRNLWSEIWIEFGGGEVVREKTFYTSDTFTVPDGVTKIYVTASAGGGGGGGGAEAFSFGHESSYSYYNGRSGGAGGTTSLGSLLSLSGGGGGGGSTVRDNGDTWSNGTAGTSHASSVVVSGYGGGGNGGTASRKGTRGGTGGRGANCSQKEIAVTPGQKLSVTIGNGGSGGASGRYDIGYGGDMEGSAGQPGIMIIKW